MDLVWGSLKDCLLEVADEVCGRAKGSQIHRQTWWWNEEVAAAIRRKQTLFGNYSRSKLSGNKNVIERARQQYMVVKREAKRVIHGAQARERKKFGDYAG